MIAAGNRSGQKIAWTKIICDKQLVSSHEAMKPLRIQLAANLLAHHLPSTTATSNRWQNQHFQCESTWLDFSDVLNIFARPFHLTVVLKLQQQRCRAFLASVHSVLRTTLFLCTMKRMNMIPSPKKAVTSHKEARRLQNLQKSKIKMTCHTLLHEKDLTPTEWQQSIDSPSILSKREIMLLYFWFWSVTLPPETQSPQWQIAQCARNHPGWPDGNADHDQANAKLGFESNGTNDPLSLLCQLIWVPPYHSFAQNPFRQASEGGLHFGSESGVGAELEKKSALRASALITCNKTRQPN